MSDAGVLSGQGYYYQAAIASMWAVRMLLNPSIEWIEVDTTSLGADQKPIPVDDIVVHRSDGKTIYCQCKKNETNYVAWSARQLGDELAKAFRLLDADDNASVHFYSRSNFGQLAKLAEYAARRNDEASYRAAITKEIAGVDAEVERLRAAAVPHGRRTLRELLLRIQFLTTDHVEQINDDLAATLQYQRATWPNATLERIVMRIYDLGARVVQPGPRPTGTHRLTREDLLDLVGDSPAAAPDGSRTSARSAVLAALRFVADRLFARVHHFLTVTLRALPDPPERLAITAHNRDQYKQLARQLTNETYLPLAVKDSPNTPPRMQSRSTFYIPVQQVLRQIAGTSTGGDAASAQIAAQSRRSRPVRNLLRYLVRAREPMVVLGEPGSGKSVTLKQLTLQIAFDDRHRVFPRLVVFVHLGRWKPSATGPDVERLVRESTPPELRHLLDRLADERRLVVIFDGMDEMSRKTYTENVAALSDYAMANLGRVHAIFSCRIADFTPVFVHRRLVLLPFGRAQMRTYVTRQLSGKDIAIDGESLTAAGVVRRLMRHDVDMSVTNPFVLSLLVKFVGEQHTLPRSRTQLIDYYYTDAVRRKLPGMVPARDALFRDWGRLAYAIAEVDEGSDLSVARARDVLGSAADDTIEHGRVSGVLHVSLAAGAPLLRFEHQRAQEFFAAHYICTARIAVDWERCIDSPGWQETLVNVSQMHGGGDVVEALSASLVAVDDDTVLQSIDAQARACARLETGARILQSGANLDRLQVLREHVVAAARRLSEGNPISRVTVLRVAQQLRGAELHGIAAAQCLSRTPWVRNQAMIVAASLADSPSASSFPTDVLSASADGSILARCANYLRAAWRLRSGALAAVVAFAFAVFVAAFVLAAAVVPAVAYAWRKEIMMAVFRVAIFIDAMGAVVKDSLYTLYHYFKLWGMTGVPLGTVIALAFILAKEPRRYWIVPAVSASLVWLAAVLLFLVTVMDTASLGFFLATASGIVAATVIAAVLVVVLAAGAGVFLTLVRGLLVGTAIAVWTRKARHIGISIEAHFEAAALLETTAIVKYFRSGTALIILAVIGMIWGRSRLPDGEEVLQVLIPAVKIYLLFLVPFCAAVFWACAILIELTIGIAASRRQRTTAPLIAKLKSVGLLAGGGTASCAVFLLIVQFGFWALDKIMVSAQSGWLAKVPASGLIVFVIGALLIVCGLAVIASAAFGLYLLFKKLAAAIDIRRRPALEIVRFLAHRSPQEQAAALSSLDIASTSDDARALYDALVRAERDIKHEPAVSAYYRKLSELQERLRHSAQVNPASSGDQAAG